MRVRWLRIQQLLIDGLYDGYEVRFANRELVLSLNNRFIAALSLDMRPDFSLPAFHARYFEGESERISLGYTDAVVVRTFKAAIEARLHQSHVNGELAKARAAGTAEMEQLLLSLQA